VRNRNRHHRQVLLLLLPVLMLMVCGARSLGTLLLWTSKGLG
jgi:hypothetical protein